MEIRILTKSKVFSK